ncbi:MAG TPA: hypothetical protein VLH79_04370 [Chthonomonadales bacterium]|nr:hypothetical protein [Chthonomonadales bacterium]
MTESNSRLTASLCFDVEDIVAPEADDAALWMAEELRAHGLRGSFFVMGELARRWERRGRRDVIEAVRRHAVGYHSTWHSVRPTTTETLLDLDFAAGIEAMRARDGAGWAETERILGVPLLGWGRTGNSWGPSVHGLMAEVGRAYVYSPVEAAGADVWWYGGSLSFAGALAGGFDEDLRDDDAFERRLAETDRVLRAVHAERDPGQRWVCFFVCHPTRAVHDAFWDAVNFARGACPPEPEWRPAPALRPDLLPVVKRNFARLCAWVREHPLLDAVGWDEAIRRFSGQRALVTREEALAIAKRVARERRLTWGDGLSAAETLLLLAEAVLSGDGPFARRDVRGPLRAPPRWSGGRLPQEALRQAAGALLATRPGACLPEAVQTQVGVVGIGTLLVAFGDHLCDDPAPEGVVGEPWPTEAEAIGAAVERAIPEWIVHPTDFDLTNLIEQTRLQCWTLKPALGE